jgi:hypothetical protein
MLSLAHIQVPYTHTMSRPTYALQLPIIILLLLAAAATDERPQLPITRPGCRDKCGNISIPFPFGMEPGCFRPGFQVYCDDHSRAFLHNSTGAYISGGGRAPLLGPRLMESNKSKSLVELFDISIDKNEARGYGAISSYCFVGPGNESIDDRPMKIHGTQLSPAGWPFVLPRKRNVVVGVGGAVEAGPVGGLYGRHTRRWLVGSLLLWVRRDVCSYAHGRAMPKRYPRGVPFVINFALGNTPCPAARQQPPPDYACVSDNSICVDRNNSYTAGYACQCKEYILRGQPLHR